MTTVFAARKFKECKTKWKEKKSIKIQEKTTENWVHASHDVRILSKQMNSKYR